MNRGILDLAKRKTSLPLFLPEKKLETGIAILFGDKRSGLKNIPTTIEPVIPIFENKGDTLELEGKTI